MSYANVTPTQALSRLLAAAKQINADECKDERVFHALQGEIGVAEGVLRDDMSECCPACHGSGDSEAMEGRGPDAYMVPCNCPHCNGSGGLLDAYNGVAHLLEKTTKQYLEACGQISFDKIRKPTDISRSLREYASNSGYSHNDYADTMRSAAEEIERYYGGMMAWKQTAETKDRKLGEEIAGRVNDRIASRVAAQSAVAAASVPIGWKLVPLEPDEMMQIRGDEATSGYVDWEIDGPSDGSNCAEMVDGIYKAMLAAAPLHEAGNAAAVQEVLSDAQRQNAELVLERLKDIRHLYPGSHTSALAKEALPCIRAILAASQSPAAAPSIAAPTEVERDAARFVFEHTQAEAMIHIEMKALSLPSGQHLDWYRKEIDAAIATGEKHE